MLSGVKYIIEEWEIEIMDNGVVKKVRSRLLFKNILKGCLFYLSTLLISGKLLSRAY